MTRINTYSGGTTINGGTLVFEKSYPAAATPSLSIVIGTGGTLELYAEGGNNNYPTSTISGTGTVKKTGSSSIIWGVPALTMALGNNSLLDIQAGTLDAGSSANDDWSSNKSSLNVAIGATLAEITYGPAVFDALTGGGSIQMNTGAGPGPNTLTVGINNHAVGVYNLAGTATFSGILSQPGKLIKVGTGTQILSGNNTFSGGIDLKGGTIRAGHINGFGTGAVTCSAPCTTGTCTVHRGGFATPNTITTNGLCTITN